MTGKAEIRLTTELQDPTKMPVTRYRLAVIAALSALALLAAAGCGSGAAQRRSRGHRRHHRQRLPARRTPVRTSGRRSPSRWTPR